MRKLDSPFKVIELYGEQTENVRVEEKQDIYFIVEETEEHLHGKVTKITANTLQIACGDEVADRVYEFDKLLDISHEPYEQEDE